MNSYHVVRKADNEVVYRYQADAPITFDGPWGGGQYQTVLVAPTPAPAPGTVYAGRRTLSKLEFLRLMTPQERMAIRTAAKQNAALEDFMKLLELAEEVRLDNPDVAAALTMIESAGLIAAGRKVEILRG